jgi:hypothetical protein
LELAVEGFFPASEPRFLMRADNGNDNSSCNSSGIVINYLLNWVMKNQLFHDNGSHRRNARNSVLRAPTTSRRPVGFFRTLSASASLFASSVDSVPLLG